jgi:glucosamine--fructose-6-phosphate aminotransferase (isomerizing)
VCSIIGYSGMDPASPLLVKGLERMEYRGYDSAGVATICDGKIVVRKGIGKVGEVNERYHLDTLPGDVGIGHTRWATHGGVTEVNAHPHISSTGEVAIVHNGIIDNYAELKKMLTARGFVFRSQTDSEAIANLLQWHYDKTEDPKQALQGTVSELSGNFAFAALFPDGTLGAARFHEPLIVGIGRAGYFVASDILGFVERTDRVVYLANKELALIGPGGIYVCDFDGKPVKHDVIRVAEEVANAGKGEFVHYTLKEIFEQPMTIPRAGADISQISRVKSILKGAERVYITGSGTSFNAALVGKYLLSKYGGITAETMISSEMKFSPAHINRDTVVIAISQSGESADVLEAVNIAREKGATIVSIVNVTTSSLALLSSVAIGLNCGPEIGVAATKSFTSQLAVLYKIAEALSEPGSGPSISEAPEKISQVLRSHERIRELAEKMQGITDVYVLGMGIHYALASEASLKLKELTYIHAEALPGGELKHGPLALLDSRSQVIILNPFDSTYRDVLASAHEVKARGAKIIGISDRPNELYDDWIEIPRGPEELFPIIEVVPTQLLSYYLGVHRNGNPDYPRNLAKSVTVK